MFAKYNQLLCKIIKTGKQYELISKNESAMNLGFEKEGQIYYKELKDLSEVDEVFELSLFAFYDTGLNKVSTEWKIELSKEYYRDEKFMLVFGEGFLPGWKVEDKSVCSTYVARCEVEKGWVVKNYIRKDGIENTETYKYEVTTEQLISTIKEFRTL